MVHSNEEGAQQLGVGVYLTQGPQEWKAKLTEDPNYFDCAALVDPTALAAVRKAWVPEDFKFPDKQMCSVLFGMFPEANSE